MYLLEVHHGLFKNPFQLQAPQHQGWTLITPCTADLAVKNAYGQPASYTLNEVIEICPFLLEAADFTDDNYDKFMSLLDTMLSTALSGQDWQTVMHKSVHSGGEVVVKRTTGKQEIHKIIQFGKKATIVRVHTFTSGVGRKIVFISHTFEKPKNEERTPKKEQDRSKDNLKAFFGAVDDKTAQLINIQGGRNGFLKLV